MRSITLVGSVLFAASVALLMRPSAAARLDDEKPPHQLQHQREATASSLRQRKLPPGGFSCGMEDSGVAVCHSECRDKCNAGAFHPDCCDRSTNDGTRLCSEFAPPGVCGSATGKPTSSPTKAPTGSPVEATGVCATDSGKACAQDSDCTTYACSGGTDDAGNTCVTSANCGDVMACSGGVDADEVCTSDDDCRDTDVCSISSEACGSDNDCLGTSGTCSGGTRKNQACTQNDDNVFTGCPDKVTGNGRVNVGTCQGFTSGGACTGSRTETCDTIADEGTCDPILDTCAVPPSGNAVPVYILFGQSNMQGTAHQDTLNQLIQDPAYSRLYGTNPTTFDHLGDGNGNWAERDDVFIDHRTSIPDTLYGSQGDNTTAKLKSMGFGVGPANMGPEVGFGWTMGDANNQEVFLIKVAWGGKSLGVDFRPPSSGIHYNGNTTYDPPCNDHTLPYGDAWGSAPYDPSAYGYYFEKTVNTVKDALADIDAGVHDLLIANLSTRRELKGIVFVQGWNDFVPSACDSNWDGIDEYEYNLANLIRDIRSSEHGIGMPNLPFIIGELGMHGPLDSIANQSEKARVEAFRQAQANIATYLEFQGNVKLAETSQYGHDPCCCGNYCDDTQNGRYCGGTTGCGENHCCQSYHYFQRPDTFWYMGVTLANAMLDLHNNP